MCSSLHAGTVVQSSKSDMKRRVSDNQKKKISYSGLQLKLMTSNIGSKNNKKQLSAVFVFSFLHTNTGHVGVTDLSCVTSLNLSLIAANASIFKRNHCIFCDVGELRRHLPSMGHRDCPEKLIKKIEVALLLPHACVGCTAQQNLYKWIQIVLHLFPHVHSVAKFSSQCRQLEAVMFLRFCCTPWDAQPPPGAKEV